MDTNSQLSSRLLHYNNLNSTNVRFFFFSERLRVYNIFINKIQIKSVKKFNLFVYFDCHMTFQI